MKKILIIFLLCCFVTSCGPKRMKCGPYRCSIEKAEKEKKFC